MAGTSFLNEIKASTPDGFKPSLNAAQPPEAILDLKFAHGYRCRDSRGNVKYASDGKIVYPCAAVGVVHNKATSTQDFFNLHQEDVISLAVHPNKDIVATGHICSQGKKQVADVFVWSVAT